MITVRRPLLLGVLACLSAVSALPALAQDANGGTTTTTTTTDGGGVTIADPGDGSPPVVFTPPDPDEPGAAPGGTPSTGVPAAPGFSPPPPPPTSPGNPTFGGSPSAGEEIVTPRARGPESGTGRYEIDFIDLDLYTLVRRFADWKRMNFIIGDRKELEGKKVSIISQTSVSLDEAYEAFVSAMMVSGFMVVETNGMARIVKTSDAARSPIDVGSGRPRMTDQVVTQLIQLENVAVAEVSRVIEGMLSADAKVTAYSPTNTLIITESANNLRKVYEILKELDVAAPRSTLAIVPLTFAEAAEVKSIIEELYGTVEATSSDSRNSRGSTRTPSRTTGSTRGRTPEPTGEASQVGESSNYISKVIDDERTNSLIVLANEQGHAAVAELVKELDVDVDPQNRAQIHVVYLEHAKAEDVSAVLSELSQQAGSTRRGQQTGRGGTTSPAGGTTRPPAVGTGTGTTGAAGEEGARGAIAAFDSGMRIAADETTNSLVIIANNEDFRVVDSVIKKLDIERKQVFVDCVIMELASEDTVELGLAAHLPMQPGRDSVGFVGGQFNATSVGLSPDQLSGLAAGVFGPSVEVPLGDGNVFPIPAFGIVLNALKADSSVDIISSPNVTTLDNQEAKIVVGRKIPFPTQSGLSNFGAPVTTFQREDVAITLQVTPRINSQDFVTLEVKLEVSEIEEDSQGLDVQQAGFITSKRELETTVLVQDNQTLVLGGLVGTTDTRVETKLPILGDIPLLGSFFRGSRSTERKTNLMVFLTPHIIDDEDDMREVQKVKEAQRQEFLRRFYGRSRDAYFEEIRRLLRYSMNYVEEPSVFRGPTTLSTDLTLDGVPLTEESRATIEGTLESRGTLDPGADAGSLPEGEVEILERPAGPVEEG